ncbi:hypothetical protein FSARC_1608 [Fusarium sarcochroum]|uniref:Ankyrin repeat protein n=1 Tax=Fusarium sarcochroum TaxID=1208366 RepID=A0A8H4U8Q1_9HYPO|nr:hypothetical protein FSARC_1608 [Fusarium sarcochroum]
MWFRPRLTYEAACKGECCKDLTRLVNVGAKSRQLQNSLSGDSHKAQASTATYLLRGRNMSHCILRLFFVLATLVVFVTADDLDDFTNNLFTDLAPILALFGERVTMQFMSQALGWADCIALAMAPLGIITILVSAIRVGGPIWLKGVIGRARENIAAAEMELMSSTSQEVCELYNGESFIRCQGTAPVWEYICIFSKEVNLQEPEQRRAFKYMSLRQAIDQGILEQHHGGPNILSQIQRFTKQRRRDQSGDSANLKHLRVSRDHTTGIADAAEDRDTTGMKSFLQSTLEWFLGIDKYQMSSPKADAEYEIGLETGVPTVIIIRDAGINAPNISLNLQAGHNRRQIRFLAGFGLIIQAGILAFFGIICYYPKLRPVFKKDEKAMAPHAFPLAASGTVILALGIFICALVVENSTQETHYVSKDRAQIGMFWLQKDQIVSDQVFESFATYPSLSSSRTIISKSHRHRSLRAEGNRFMQYLTIIGVASGLVGFIIQFVGFRAMNSFASIAQLIATGVMTIGRAVVRPGYSRSFEQVKLLPGFELEWLARKLTSLGDSLPEGQGDKPNVINGLWRPVTVKNSEHVRLEPLLEKDDGSLVPETQQILEVRRELCKLANFQSQTSAQAVNLAIAIEKALTIFFPTGTGDPSHTGFKWSIDVIHSRAFNKLRKRTQVSFDLLYRKNAWQVPADSLDAALSLWIYTVKGEEKQDESESDTQQTSNGENKDEWLRRKALHPSLRCLSPVHQTKTRLLRDLEVWGLQRFEFLLEAQERFGSDILPDTNSRASSEWSMMMNTCVDRETTEDSIIKRFQQSRVVGCNTISDDSEPTQERYFETFPPDKGRKHTFLAIEGQDSLESLYAKDLLYSFMCSAAKTLPKPIRSKVEIRPIKTGDSNQQGSEHLWNKDLADLADTFSRTGFGPEPEVRIGIVSSLSMASKLPYHLPYAVLESVSFQAHKTRSFQEALEVYRDFFQRMVQFAPGTSGVFEHGLAFLLEALGDIKSDFDIRRKEPWTESQKAQIHLDHLLHDVNLESAAHDDFYTHLDNLYKMQGRSIADILPGRPRTDIQPIPGQFPDYFNVTCSHLEAMNMPMEWSDGWDTHERDICGWTPLHYFLCQPSGDSASKYLRMSEGKTKAEVKDYRGYTRLHYVCRYSDTGLPFYFVPSRKKHFFVQSWDGMYPGHLAARYGRIHIFDEILTGGPMFMTGDESPWDLRDYRGRIPLHWAVINNHSEVVQRLRHNIDVPDDAGWTALHLAVMHSEPEIIKLVCDLSTDKNAIDNKGRTPLHLACEMKIWAAVDQLIQRGADVDVRRSDTDGRLVRDQVVFAEANLSSIRRLIGDDSKGDCSRDVATGIPMVNLIARGGDRELMHAFLRTVGSDIVNFQDEQGNTPLHIAAQYRNKVTLEVLLEHDANPNIRNKWLVTPWHCAMAPGIKTSKQAGPAMDIANTLIENGAVPE